MHSDLHQQGGDTPIDTVVRAATGHQQILTLYTKEVVESLHILQYTIQRSQAVKSFSDAVKWSSSKMTVKIS